MVGSDGMAEPPRQVGGTDERADDEESQRHQHAGTAAADGEQGARAAAAAELHAEPEDRRAEEYRHPDRGNRAGQRATEHAALREQRNEHDGRDGDHQHLGAHRGAATLRRPCGRQPPVKPNEAW
jgi:hypothetical protein